MRTVLRNTHFARLLTGQFISQLGDGLINLSLMIMINRLLGQIDPQAAAGSIGILLICQTVPRVAIGLLSGVYVDRLDRKRLMIVSDIARGLIVLTFLLVQRAEDVWIYYIGALAMAAIGTVFAPAKDASLPHLVPTQQLLIANSLSQSSFVIAVTSGSALAGVLLGVFKTPAPAIIFDAVSFFVSAAFIMTLPIPHRSKQQQDQSARQVWHELKEGLHYLRHQRALIGALVGFGVVMLGVGAINVLFVPFLVDDLHMPETYLGFIDLTQMVGMVFINLFIAAIARRFKPEHIIGGGIIGLGISLGVVGWVQTAWVLFPISIAWGLFLAPVDATATMLMQRTPDHIRGRVLSTTGTITGTTNVISMALAGVAGASIGPRTAFIGGGALGMAGGILAWLVMRGQSPETTATIEQAVPVTIDIPAEED